VSPRADFQNRSLGEIRFFSALTALLSGKKMNLVASGCLWPSLATKAQGFAAHRAADSRERFCLLKSVLASPRFLLKDFQNLCHTTLGLTGGAPCAPYGAAHC